MDKFDLTVTATLRPELLKKTLDSHVKYLFKDRILDARLILNIDYAGIKYIGNLQKKIEEIFSVISKHPFYEIVIRKGRQPHFPTAFIWCMNQIKNKYVFHLEEDWLLKIDLDFEKMVSLFEEDSRLAHLRLSATRSEEKTLKNWNKFLDWNGKYFQVPKDIKGTIGWAGHPSFNKSSFLKTCVKYMNPQINPEKQIKHNTPGIDCLIEKHKFGSFHPQNTPATLEDIGRAWMQKNGFKKAGVKAFFVEWEKAEDKKA